MDFEKVLNRLSAATTREDILEIISGILENLDRLIMFNINFSVY